VKLGLEQMIVGSGAAGSHEHAESPDAAEILDDAESSDPAESPVPAASLDYAAPIEEIRNIDGLFAADMKSTLT